MAKRFVRVSLATKFRLLVGAAVLGVIVAALIVPWYFMELLAEQGVERPATELAQMRLREFKLYHADKTRRHLATNAGSTVRKLYEQDRVSDAVSGPVMVTLVPEPDPPLRGTARKAAKAFLKNDDLPISVIKTEDRKGNTMYRCYLPVRAESDCLGCHDGTRERIPVFTAGSLVAMIEVGLPSEAASGPVVFWTHVAFVLGGAVAILVAFLLFSLITHRLILRPLGKLRDMADLVADGDLTVRSDLKTGDEFQRLGESYNDMLEAITVQTEKLRAANRALDIKLNELAEANVTLFRANKVKSEFLANISHELRTPLNSIIGFADLVAESEDKRVQRWGQNIGKAARDLLNMINELLDLAKIEAGRADVNLDKVSIAGLCETLLALLQPLADKKQLELTSQIAEDLPLVVTDGGKVQQILYNLLSNAVKFTPAGGQVSLSARLEAANRPDAADGAILLSVADTGPGITEADQQRIFDKFYQADRTLTRESGGTGLGLAISRELANLLGARLSLKSTPGHGATFSIRLPLTPPASAAGDEADAGNAETDAPNGDGQTDSADENAPSDNAAD